MTVKLGDILRTSSMDWEVLAILPDGSVRVRCIASYEQAKGRMVPTSNGAVTVFSASRAAYLADPEPFAE